MTGRVSRGDVDVLGMVRQARRVQPPRTASSAGDCDRPDTCRERHGVPIGMVIGAVDLSDSARRCVYPRAIHIDIRPLSSIEVRDHQLADQAVVVVEEDMAVEEPAAKRTTRSRAVFERAVVEANAEGEV